MKNQGIIRVLWVDDDLEHKKADKENIEDALIKGKKRLKIDLIGPDELSDHFGHKTREPDIFLVDYFLDLIPLKEGKKYKFRGLEIAGAIREKYPTHPIFLISNQLEIFKEGVQAAKMIFDKIFEFKEIQRNGHNILYYFGRDYKYIRTSIKEKDIDSLFDSLKAPKIIRDQLKLALPTDLKNGLHSKNQDNSLSFARWVQEELLRIPGFLYNDLYAATHLGMKLEIFKEISEERNVFKKAKYSGVFSEINETFWWVSELDDIVFSLPGALKQDSSDPWVVAPISLKIPIEGRSKCEVCKEDYPDIVATHKFNKDNIKPVHYRCSEPNEEKRGNLFFDEYRTFHYKNES